MHVTCLGFYLNSTRTKPDPILFEPLVTTYKIQPTARPPLQRSKNTEKLNYYTPIYVIGNGHLCSHFLLPKQITSFFFLFLLCYIKKIQEKVLRKFLSPLLKKLERIQDSSRKARIKEMDSSYKGHFQASNSLKSSASLKSSSSGTLIFLLSPFKLEFFFQLIFHPKINFPGSSSLYLFDFWNKEVGT